jgi:phage anti-repressor protein
MSIILAESHATIIDKWMEQERNGVRFPADFEIVWKISGYSNKANAKRKLSKLSEGSDFIISDEMVSRPQGGGKKAHLIKMTCDAVKHFCLLAETDQGRAIRQYFIEAEKRWKLVEQHRPDVAHDVEMMKLKIELAQIEAQKEAAIAQGKNADLQLTQFRHYVTTALPEPIQQKILGYQTVKETEVVERTVNAATGDVFDGVGITYIAKALGFRTNAQCWTWLERHGYGKDSEHWHNELTAIHTPKLSRDDLDYLKDLIKDSSDRQMFLGE